MPARPDPQSYDEWHRRTYGLGTGGHRWSQRRHDPATWGQAGFTQNTSSRQLDRINETFDRASDRRMDNNLHDDNARKNPDPSWHRVSHLSNEMNQFHYDAGEAKYRGKGPKGYKRSDDKIKDDINDRLTDDAWLDASDIEVNVESSEVILTGTVSDRFAKRRAEDIAELVAGVVNVENRLRVRPPEEQPGTRVTSTASEIRKGIDYLS